MSSRSKSTIGVLGLLVAWVGGCPSPADTDDSETTPGTADGPTTATDDPSTCTPEPACAGVQLDDPLLSSGWAMGGDGQDMTIFLSSPGTACGDEEPGECTECGIFDSVAIVLPPGAQAPGTYTEADVDLRCGSVVSDCMGNGEGEGGAAMSFTLEITSIDAGCVVGQLVESGLCSADSGQFAVIRCPS